MISVFNSEPIGSAFAISLSYVWLRGIRSLTLLKSRPKSHQLFKIMSHSNHRLNIRPIIVNNVKCFFCLSYYIRIKI